MSDPIRLEPVVPVAVLGLDSESASACLVLAKKLRAHGIGCVTDTRDGKLGKKLERASKERTWVKDGVQYIQEGVYYAVIIGPSERAEGKVTLKDLDERTSETVSEEEAIAKLVPVVTTPEDRMRVAAHRALLEARALQAGTSDV